MSIREPVASIFTKLAYLEGQLSIKGKIRALFLAALLLCVLITLPLLYFGSANFTLKLQKSSAETIVKLVEKSLAKSVADFDLARTDEILSQIRLSLSIQEYCLFNQEKVLIKSADSSCQLHQLPYLEELTQPEGQVAGYLYLLPQQQTKDITSLVVCIALCLLAIYFILSFLLLARLQKIITRPLEELSQAVSEFSTTNDFHIRATTTSDDEIGRLAQMFNILLQDMRKKEHALIRAKNHADEANELKGEFLASVSHEIRTPMNGIIGTAELLLESLDTQKHKNYTSTILRSSESLLAIINDILDFSKIESGKLDIEEIPFDLYSEVEDVADLMAIKAIEKGLEIIISISPYIPSHVIGDPSRLRQIITNLVNNAIKFTQKGHVLIEVEAIGCQIEGDKKESLRFSVVDTGIGISEEAQNKIFERFTQAESSITRQYGGTGLGLAICKQLIGLMGGEIFVESVEGKGSTFSFTLTFQVDDSDNKSDEPEHLEGIRALVVDDNPYFLEHIKSALRFYGLRIQCAGNAKEALNTLNASSDGNPPFEIIIIDENMPLINGSALAEKIMLTYVDQAPPIIVLNDVNADVRQEQFYTKVGISACMQKPVRIRQLISLIDLALSEHAEGNMGQLLSVDEMRSSHSSSSKPLKLASPHIVVAEENDVHYKFISNLLLNAGAHITRSKEGNDTVQQVMNNHCDLLIVSADLPELPGIEVASVLKKINSANNAPSMPIIITSTEDNEQIKSISVGIDAYLPKQLIKNQLLNKVAVLLPNFVVDNHNGLVKFDNVKVLLVEDNRVNAQITTEILMEFGCEIELCSNGKGALETVKSKRFDVVLMDCQMPIMDGFESTRHIRHFENVNNRANTPIIALTANAMKGDNERCYSAGMDDYITKPIKREKLRQILTDYIEPSKICVSHATEEQDNAVILQEHFQRFSHFTDSAGIQLLNYIQDIERSLVLIKQQYTAQPPKIVYETAQTIAAICIVLGFNRLHSALSHLAKMALELHADKVNETSMLTQAVSECERALKLTLNQLEPLLPTPVNTMPDPETEELILTAEHLPTAPSEPNDMLAAGKSDEPTTTSPDANAECSFVNFSNPTKKSKTKVFANNPTPHTDDIDQTIFGSTQNIFKDKFCRILDEYFEDAEEYLQEIIVGVDIDDTERVREAAHPLKSSSFTLGLSGIGQIAKEIEIMAKQQEPMKTIEPLALLLRPKLNKTFELVAEEIPNLQASIHKEGQS